MSWDESGEIAGEVIAVNDNEITVQTDDGDEVTLNLRRNKMSDPNWMLIEARNAVGDFRNAMSVSEVERSANKLADTFEALDEWLLKGGFLPADWLVAINPPPASVGCTCGQDFATAIEFVEHVRKAHLIKVN